MIITPYNRNNEKFEFHFKEGNKNILRNALLTDSYKREHLKENSILFTDFKELETFTLLLYDFYEYIKKDHIDNPNELARKEDWYWMKGVHEFDKEIDNSEIKEKENNIK